MKGKHKKGVEGVVGGLKGGGGTDGGEPARGGTERERGKEYRPCCLLWSNQATGSNSSQ